MIAIGISLLALVGALAYTMLFRVKDIHYGLPSSLFTGRIRNEKDEQGFSIPIHQPYKEGFGIKMPWWTISEIPSGVRTLELETRSYACKKGSVDVGGLIRYRASSVCLYRFKEFDNEEELNQNITGATDQKIAKILGASNIEAVITRQGESDIAGILHERFTSPILFPDDPERKEVRRVLFGKEVTFAENSYGSEILEVQLNIDPSKKIKESRDDIVVEENQRESQKIETAHSIKRAKEIKKDFPDMSSKESFDQVKILQGKSTEEIKKFKVEGLDSIANSIGSALGYAVKSAMLSIAAKGKGKYQGKGGGHAQHPKKAGD